MNSDCTKFFASLTLAALLQACSQNVGPVKVQRDVTNAQVDGEKMVIDAQANLVLVNTQNNNDVVSARVWARAHDPRNASTAATNNADARRSRTEATQKIADARFDVDKAKAKASHNVAIAECEARTDAAAKSCKDDAAANYDSEMATAKAQKVAAHLHSKNNG
jgi:hypothetical protein